MVLSTSELNKALGRPKSFRPVQVQNRLPWLPRRSDGRVQVVLCHPLLADHFVATCRAAASVSRWVPQRIDSYNPRPIRGVDLPDGWKLGDKGTSRHAWGAAFDFFATPADVPPPGGVWTPENGVPAEFAAAFEKRGWTWGARWRRKDVPHIEIMEIPRAGNDSGIVDWLTELLKQGDSGDEVWALQFMLRAAGLSVTPTGVFDGATKGAVVSVQEASGITVDGIAGPQTEQAINGVIIARHGSALEVVRAAYRDVLGRDPDDEGARFWVAKLEAGDGVHKLWRALWDSGEARRRRASENADLRSRYEAAMQALTEQRGLTTRWQKRAEDAERQLADLEGEVIGLGRRLDSARVLVTDALKVLSD